MDILSPDTMTLLRDENLRKAVCEVLDRVTESKTVTVTTTSERNVSSGGQSSNDQASTSTQVTVRRVA